MKIKNLIGILGLLVGGCMQSQAEKIWVERESYHTAIIIPRILVVEAAPQLEAILDDKPFVRFGWGDRDYYGSTKKNLFKAFKALALPSLSVVEVSMLDKVESEHSEVKEIDTEAIALEKLMAFIEGSFKLDKESKPQLVRVEDNGFQYYKARGIYHMFKNCNNWTAKTLKRSGLDVHYLASFFAGWVMRQI
ncbi:MAG: DUF2459 domain-containing protein [Methyloligellaceae bacterium]